MLSHFVRRLAGVGLAVGALVALSGCVITSATNLLDTDALVTPLPASFTMYPYKEGPGGFIAAEDEPAKFTLNGKTYVVSDKSMSLEFEPLDGETYLLAVGGEEPGTIYGTLTYRDGVAAIRLLLAGDASAAVDAIKASAAQEIADDLAYKQDGLLVSRRTTLDYAIGKLVAGDLPTETLIAFIGNDDAKLPATIVERDGQFVPGK